MAQPHKLPPYFQEFLDERFQNLENQLGEVKLHVQNMELSFKTLNGSVSEAVGSTKKNTERLKRLDKLELCAGRIESDLAKLDAKYNDKLNNVSKRQREFAYRIIIALIIGTFVWVKESRDMLIKLLLGIAGA